MAEVKVTINGKEITADDGMTILQVVREHELDDIPTLCYEERLEPITSCFLCVVEVEGARNLVPSCSTKIGQGMVIRTRTDKVLEARRTCLELLFSDHFADCISPCSLKCPAGVDIQGYLSLVSRGLHREAIELIKEKNPLPIVCGRVCVRECEVGCRRGIIDKPVGIDHIKRFAAESMEGLSYVPTLKPPRNKRVAIVGSGPAGLSAAFYLAREGYHVTIYEGMPRPGGMLRYGIPAYRLPKDLLDWEIESISRMGVNIQCKTALGKDITISELMRSYDALLLAQGAWGASKMGVENEECSQVLSGLEVLREVAQGSLKEMKGRVLVIGGGNTAIDASRTAQRIGAADTTILYRRTEAEMPAHHEEIAAAKLEGVDLKLLVAPRKVITDEKGKLLGLQCIRMELGAADESGRRKPVPVEGSEYVEKCDYVLSAIGQYPELTCLEHEGSEKVIKLNRRGCFDVDRTTMETSIPGVFAAGDAVSGPATVIEAIAGGRRAAYSIDRKLSGNGRRSSANGFHVLKDHFAELSRKDFPAIAAGERQQMPERPPQERIKDFKEVETGLSRKQIECEAARCLSCGCIEVDQCALRKYGEEYGAMATHYRGMVNRYEVDESHQHLRIDPNKCIKCGRCIKTCDRILGESALGFINRGFSTTIAPALGHPLASTNCISCGNCIDSCPTGAISEKMPLCGRIMHKWSTSSSVCSLCSAGCHLSIKTFGRDMRIESGRDRVTGSGDYLCSRGRFGSDYLNREGRIIQPALKRERRLFYTGWRKAMDEISRRLSELKRTHGGNSIGVFLSPALTNEEIYAGVKFARSTVATSIVGSMRELMCGRDHHELDHIIGQTSSTVPAEHIQDADVILLINADPTESHPVLGWKIKDAVRNGAKLIIMNSARISLSSSAELWLQPRRGTSAYAIAAIMQEILSRDAHNQSFITEETENFDEFRRFLKSVSAHEAATLSGVHAEDLAHAARLIAGEKGRTVVAVYDMDSLLDRSRGDLEATANLLLLTGNLWKKGSGLLLLEKYCNTRGLYDMGAEPGYLPGRNSLGDEDARAGIMDLWNSDLTGGGEISHKPLPEVLAEELKGAFIIGENPLRNPSMEKYLRNLELLAVCDLFPTETTDRADIVLPASTHIESGGSFTSFDGKIQHFSTIMQPPSGRTILQMLSELSGMLGNAIALETKEKAHLEIKKAVTSYKRAGTSIARRGHARFSPFTMETTTFSSHNLWID